MADLHGERFVDVQADWWSARIMLDTAFITARVSRRVVVEVNEWEVIVDLVRNGVGAAFVARGVAQRARDGALHSFMVTKSVLQQHISSPSPDRRPHTRRQDVLRIAKLDEPHEYLPFAHSMGGSGDPVHPLRRTSSPSAGRR